MTDREFRRKLIRYKRRKRDQCIERIKDAATLGCMILIFYLMVVVYILQTGPI